MKKVITYQGTPGSRVPGKPGNDAGMKGLERNIPKSPYGNNTQLSSIQPWGTNERGLPVMPK